MGWTWKSIVLRYVCIGMAGALIIATAAAGQKALQSDTLQKALRKHVRTISPASRPLPRKHTTATVSGGSPATAHAPATLPMPPEPLSRNPYREEMAERRRELSAFQSKARALTAERDRATGAERMRIIDELGGMRAEGIRLSRAYGEAKAKYESWNGSSDAGESIATPAAGQD